MTARVVAALGGRLSELVRAERGALAGKLTLATDRAAARAQAELRAQTRPLGPGLEKAWRKQTYPKGRASLGPAALVYSKAVRLHDAFARGAEVAARRGRFLVIPSDAAVALGLAFRSQGRKGFDYGRTGVRRAKWSDIEAAAAKLGRLRTVKAGPRIWLVFADGLTRARRRGLSRRLAARGLVSAGGFGKSVLLFTLVKNVRVRKLLDIEGAGRRAIEQLVAEAGRES